MENLIKPVDYAKKMGISRQAVYAKIKKGLLPSRNVGGKIYIVQENEEPAGGRETAAEAEEVQPLLAAKDETIAVLKETIRDLKETNQMITSTLRSEVELLKEAFGEMKALYAARIEQMNSEEPLSLEETLVEEAGEAGEALEDSWVSLEEFLIEQGIRKKKQRERFTKKTKKLYKKGDTSVEKKNGDYRIKAEKAVEILLELKNS